MTNLRLISLEIAISALETRYHQLRADETIPYDVRTLALKALRGASDNLRDTAREMEACFQISDSND